MKTIYVRGLVLTLALVGFGASRISAMAPKTASIAAPTDPGSPTPMCPLNDPNGCGIL